MDCKTQFSTSLYSQHDVHIMQATPSVSGNELGYRICKLVYRVNRFPLFNECFAQTKTHPYPRFPTHIPLMSQTLYTSLELCLKPQFQLPSYSCPRKLEIALNLVCISKASNIQEEMDTSLVRLVRGCKCWEGT